MHAHDLTRSHIDSLDELAALRGAGESARIARVMRLDVETHGPTYMDIFTEAHGVAPHVIRDIVAQTKWLTLDAQDRVAIAAEARGR